ncbi:tetratricopeptide repeat-containing protein [Sphingomonas sp. SRS2]|uniref:tetratricopeptide repeat-containing protein n=1 Tax=Sphingomonas sp. SRS2 TaxID=133190 RepID=UPI0006184D10|nr:tetratricopeptide repeat-containing protein [Sphingomonas sp. SRS2]KKC27509.1 hypothetical protein WP12_02825 [Sphingomonas sp. SRS2]
MTLSNLTRIRQIARTGDTLRAWRMFEAAGLLASNHPDALSLRGRLLKDRALKANGEQRSAFFDQAEAAYLQSAGARRATYPLINAATIAFLNGKTDQARLLAEKTLALLESGNHDPETSYWLGATRAEAELLLGRFDAGKATLEAAIASTPSAWEDHAATLGQLRLILEEADRPATLLDHLRPPASLHFSGLIGLAYDDQVARAAINGAFDAIRPGFVFGALAAGADIVVAEIAITHGAQLHVVLPTSIASFREQSVARFGADWSARFDRLIDLAEMVETLADGDALSDAGITLGEEVAMGLTIRRARTLASKAVALRVRRPSDPPFPSETAWRRRGLPFREVMVERSAARSDQPLAPRSRRVILASARPLPPELPLPSGATVAALAGIAIVQFDSLADAADFAVAALRAMPDNRIGLDYRIVDRGDDQLEEIAGTAALLARAAPAASIYAASPGVLAMDLHAPHLKFEAAGEIVTPIGDIPVSMLSLSPEP